MREVIGPLVGFNYWANHRLLDAVASLPADAFTREVGREFSVPTLQGMLVHLMGAEAIWLCRWRGASQANAERAEAYPAIATLRARWGEVERELRAFVDGLTEADLRREFDYRLLSGEPGRSVLWHAIQHVVDHGTHHRSEVATMLTRLGTSPPGTGLIAYYRSAAQGAGR